VAGFWALIIIFTANFAAQNAAMLVALRGLVRGPRLHIDRALMRRVLHYSWPLIPYLGLGLFLYSADKYLVRTWLEGPVFSAYVLTFQYAFAQMFLSQGLSLFAYPRICDLASRGDRHELFAYVGHLNWIYALGGLVFIPAMMIIDRVVHLGINPTLFPVVGVSFVLLNVATSYINVLYATDRTRTLMLIGLVAGAVFLGTLTLGVRSGGVALCYWAHVVYGALMCGVPALFAARTPLGLPQVQHAAAQRVA
jgi:O-antigen/teichoic acid export membrane protein